MNSIELFLLDLGLSWTMSKMLPYIFMVLIGLIIVLLFKKRLKKLGLILRLLIKFIILLIPFVVYFAIAPIYQGDFSNNSIEIEKIKDYSELKGKKLVVLTIPGCPYCYEALGRMKKLKERVPNIEIEYLVCHPDEETTTWYKDEAGKDVEVKLALNPDAMAQLAVGSFPTFVLVEEDQKLRTWSNDNFGVSAMDELELKFK
ncbi:MAG: DsbA family protein [Crocinitomicaceae bacterium]|nr:DsbA family protein [Crocinitomicaceae bacterium]